MKAQSSTEMIIAVSFLVLFVILAFIAYSKRIEDSVLVSHTLEAKRICYKISSLIIRVQTNENGFSENLYFDKDYTVIIEGDNGLVNVKNSGDVICSFPVVGVSDGLESTFTLTKGNYSVTNERGLVVFKKI